jgi:hypothetical protein
MSLLADIVDFSLERQPVDALERETQEQVDSALKHAEGVVKGTLHLLLCSLNGRGIGNTPVRGQRLARPHWANFFGGTITDGEHEIELGCIWLGKLFPE